MRKDFSGVYSSDRSYEMALAMWARDCVYHNRLIPGLLATIRDRRKQQKPSHLPLSPFGNGSVTGGDRAAPEALGLVVGQVRRASTKDRCPEFRSTPAPDRVLP